MKPVDRYLDEVLHNVFATTEEKKRFAGDLRAHFEDAEAEGLAHRDIVAGLGSPDEVAAAFNAERAMQYAGFWQRLFAFLGDIGLLTALSVPIFAFAFLTGVLGETPSVAPTAWFVLVGLMLFTLGGIYIFYFPLLESHFGKTLGKHLLRLQVRRENGSSIGLGQAFVRRLSLYFDMLWIDALFVPFTDKHQRALDIVAKTVVAKEPGREAPWWSYFICVLLLVVPIGCLFGLMFLCAPH